MGYQGTIRRQGKLKALEAILGQPIARAWKWRTNHIAYATTPSGALFAINLKTQKTAFVPSHKCSDISAALKTL